MIHIYFEIDIFLFHIAYQTHFFPNMNHPPAPHRDIEMQAHSRSVRA